MKIIPSIILIHKLVLLNLWMSLPTLTYALTTNLKEDTITAVLREVTGNLERFNSLYITNLERQLTAHSSSLASLDATVRTIANRALAWDNIQNHMAVWTDQTRTMEKKMDILNRCHEKQEAWESKLAAIDALNHKLTALDQKINSMTRLEFKVEQVSERLEEVDSKIEWLRKQGGIITHSRGGSGTEQRVVEFAGRGLLGTLLTVEGKIDNITRRLNTSPIDSYSQRKSRARLGRPTGEPQFPSDPGPSDGTSCQLDHHDSQTLGDVSAKIDLMFDRITDPDYDYNNLLGSLSYSDGLSGRSSGGPQRLSNVPEYDSGSPEHIFAKFWKSLFAPFKKMNKKFRSFENQLSSVHRSCNESGDLSSISLDLGSVIKQGIDPLDQILREEMEETRMAVNDQTAQMMKIAQTVGDIVYIDKQLQSEVTRQFQSQRVSITDHFDDIRNLIPKFCGNNNNNNKNYDNNNNNNNNNGGYSNGHSWSGTTNKVVPSQPPPAPTPTRSITETEIPNRSFPSTRSQPESTPNRPWRFRHFNKGRKKTNRCTPRGSPLLKMPGLVNRIPPLCPEKDNRVDKYHHYQYHYKYADANNMPNYNDDLSKPDRKWKEERWKNSRNRHKRQTMNSFDLPIMDCSDIISEDYNHSGVVINFANDGENNDTRNDNYYTRFCDLDTAGGGWTVIQRRGMFGTPIFNFTKSWNEYKNGFGNIQKEFWWGNENIRRLAEQQDMIIRFDLWDFEDNYAFAEYMIFKLGSEKDQYPLEVSDYRGNASDSFSAHNGYLFSTYDRDNDKAPECCPCAPAYGGGWWFYSCFESNLNGHYYLDPTDNEYYRGLIWELWLGDYSLKATEIKLRPAHVYSSISGGGGSIFPTPYPGPFSSSTIKPEDP